MLAYSRRVSFNNLYPIYIDPSNPVHVPPQFKNEQDQQNKSRFFDLNFGFGGATINNIEEHYTKALQQQPVFQTRRKAPKLPPPPSRSILKKNNHKGEINYTLKPNVLHHRRQSSFGQSVLTSDEEEDDDDDHEVVPPSTPPLESVKPRRKSFANMTAEELILLEDSYTTKSSLNIESFNFGSVPTSQLQPLEPKLKSNTNSLTPTITTSPASPTAGAGSVERSYPSRPVINHGACCISANHKDYDRLFNDESANRVMLSCITGRRHTWNAIDYMVDELVVDGDHLVITSHIPIVEVANLKKYKSFDEDEQEPEFESSRNYNFSSNIIYEKCQNILDYTIKLISDRKLILKISVEIINCGSSKEVFNDSLKLYKPHVFVIGSKTDELMYRSLSICSTSSNDQELRPPMQRKNSSTISTLGKGYNGYYKIGGVRCMKLTSYTIKHSTVPVIIVTSNYISKRFKNESPFDDDINEFNNDINQFKNKLTAISDISRTRTIKDLKQMMDSQYRITTTSSLVSSSSADPLDDDEEPRTFYPKNATQYLQPTSSSSQKVSFKDDLGFGNGQSIYKVKSLLDPVEDKKPKSSLGRHNSHGSTGSSTTKKKTQRSKSDSSAISNSADDAANKFVGLSLKKFGFGRKK